MVAAHAYEIIENMAPAGQPQMFRAVRSEDHRQVALKVLHPDRCLPRALRQLRNEYEIARPLDTPAVLKVLAFESYDGGSALVIEDFRAQTLDRLLGSPMRVERFIALAVRIASALAEIHRCGLIHKDVNPSNILVSPDETEVKISGFGLASRLPSELQELEPPRLLEGTLAYLSPEQTGRMNRVVDSRSDLYMLGVTFYEMLTGRLPFQGRDPIEWVHNHLARVPAPPSEIATVPVVLSNIVLRLLAKHAEDRYQSALGLVRDLEHCHAAWSACRTIEPFSLGEEDAIEKFQIPQRLYGRRAELGALRAAFARVKVTGQPEVVTVSGQAGIGKSALVHELLQYIVQGGGLFLEGKFDQYKRNIPYASIGQAFAHLAREMLSESEERLAAVREQLLGALGSNARLITETIPEMELVIGPQPEVPALPPEEAELRFHTTFARFVAAFSTSERPLVLFIDDLQWTDEASLGVLSTLLTHPDLSHVLIIGAYRDGLDASHPLTGTLARIRGSQRRVDDLVLRPLSSRHLNELVADSVRRPRPEVRSLTRLVGEKTAGNPFFAIQFLVELARERLLDYAPALRGWRWNVERIREKGYTDNVVDLMLRRLDRLTAETRHVCALAACVGNTSDAESLATVCARSEEDLRRTLHDAIGEGLLVRSGDRYRFAHDRVQQAAYSLIPRAERPAIHLRIGRLLFERTPVEKRDECIFEIVTQLNQGRAAQPESDWSWTADLNLAAGRKAKSAIAYDAAAAYIERGIELLPPDAWTRCYDLTLALYLERARCEYHRGRFDDAMRAVREVLAHAKTNLDVANAYRTQIEIEVRDRPATALESGVTCLRLLGVEVSMHPSRFDVERAYDEVRASVGDRTVEELLDLPSMTDPSACAAMDVLASISSPSFLTDANSYCLIGCRMVQLSIVNGNSDTSCFGYGIFGYVLGAEFGRYQEGTRFGRLGYDLVQRRHLVGYKALMLLQYAISAAWTDPLERCRALWKEAFDAGRESGALTHASAASTFLVPVAIFRGDPLDDAYRTSEMVLSFAREVSFASCEALVIGRQRLIDRLRGRAARAVTFATEELDPDQFVARMEQLALRWAAFCYFVCCLQGDFILGDFEGALRAAEKAAALRSSSEVFPVAAERRFYEALTLAATYETSSAAVREQSLQAIEAHEAQLRQWAGASRATFLAMHALVRAELARLRRRDLEAIDAYELAIRSAAEEGYVNVEATAYELAARFYARRGQCAIEELYIAKARSRYARWGAEAKVQQLDERHPKSVESGSRETASVALSLEQLDFGSVIEASQAISREIVLDDLGQTLLRLVTELGGAQRGYLVLVRKGRPRIEAEATLSAGGVSARRLSLPLAKASAMLPRTILEYTRRAGERIVLDDARRSDLFRNDPYVIREMPRSVLCLPVLRQGEVFSLIYLENRTTAGLFGLERLAALEVLAAQAAISIENALLVEREQGRRAEAEAAERRTAFLGESTSLLGESLEQERTLGALARQCVGALCDWCVIDLVDNGELRRVAGAHVDPTREHLVGALRTYSPRAGSRAPASIVRATGNPVRLPNVTDELLRSTCVDDEHVTILRELGTRVALAVPLLARGELLGVLTMGSGKPGGRLDSADFDLVKELGRRAGIAIDNARLYAGAQTAIRLRDEFLQVASHELRTPLAVLTIAIHNAHAKLTASPPSRERETSLLERVDRQVVRLKRLVDAMLDVSRIQQAGSVELVREETNLSELVRDAAEQLALDLQRSGSALSVDVGRPVVGHWDAHQLEQVVVNLLSNAIKFGEGRPIAIRTVATDEGAVLTVRDHGIGIAPELQQRAFERFTRGVSAKQYGGLGLGLWIARSIVEAHGGTIGATSEPEAGTVFTVTLPFDQPTPEATTSFEVQSNVNVTLPPT